jgi:hypothetical protein
MDASDLIKTVQNALAGRVPSTYGSTTLRSPADRKVRRHPSRQTPHQALPLPSASADKEIAG